MRMGVLKDGAAPILAPASPVEAARSRAASVIRRWCTRLNIEGCIAVLAVLIAWQVASGFLPAFLFPPLEKIGATLIEILADPRALGTIVLTYARIVGALVATFVLATLLGIWAAVSARVDRALAPLIQLKQGVPGVCWAIFAVIWFQSTELRIAFVVIVSILPIFFFQARDGFRAISRDLWEMVRAWRPSPLQMLRKLVLPGLVPAMLTGWRINLGNGARIAVTAELLAGISGIGHQLRTAQEQFRMDTALAWTAILAAFILLSDYGMARIERHLLKWRDQPRSSV